MKRYWKLITVVMVIILTFGTFYINSVLSASSYPEIEFEKVSGNEDVLKPVILQGSYLVDGLHDRLKFTAEASIFHDELSFLESLQGLQSPMVIQLQDRYRNFMRGKSSSVASFYDGEEKLAYANVVNQSFDGPPSMEFAIDVLNKKSNETVSFTVPVPNRAMYSSVHVEDVQMIGGNLKIVTQNFLKYKGSGKELHVYTFDLNQEDISEGKRLASVESENNNIFTRIDRLWEADTTGKHNYIAFSKTKEGMVSENKQGGAMELEDTSQVIVYNLKKEKEVPLDLPKELQRADAYSIDDSTLYFKKSNEKQSSIVGYRLDTTKVEKELVISDSNTSKMQDSGMSVYRMSEGKMYIITNYVESRQDPKIRVINIKSGETLYKGKITTKESSDQNYQLHFFEMWIK